ncbi:MAG: DUF362 domain-containing protein [Candidatus Omnitrophota bacterium]
MNAKVSLVKCKNYEPSLVFDATRKSIDLLGGMASFVTPRSKVLVKPNILMAIEPEAAVDTHPEVVRAVIKLLKELDCQVYLGDGPSVWGNQGENINWVYEKSGMKRIAEEEQTELVSFDKKRWQGKFPITTSLDNCDSFISIPKFKTHSLTILTGAIKNLFGLIPGTFKTELHKNYFDRQDFAKILVDILEVARPALTIVDGITAMEADGPGTGGKLRNQGVLVAGSDCVAIDSVLALIMGIKPNDILTTKEGARRNLGISDINSISVVGESLIDVIESPFILPTPSLSSRIPRPAMELAKKLIKFYPYVERRNCTLCTACIDACPNKAISIRNDKIIINYRKCIACFCCEEACPYSAIKIKKSLAAKMIGL